MAAKKPPIVIQIMDVPLKPPGANRAQTCRSRVAAVRDDLERTLHAEGFVYVHQLGAEVEPRARLHVLHTRRATAHAFRHDPYNRTSVGPAPLQLHYDPT